jgi:hypothetical protein
MSQPPRATEVIYLRRSSALPAVFAAGLAAIVIGLYAWWPYSVAGALIALVSLIAWLRGNRDDIAAMPTRQPTDTAPIPLSGRE